MRRTLLALCAPLALLAAAAQAAVTAEQAVRAAPDKVAVTWTATGPVDVYVTERPDAALAAAKLVSANDRDGRFEMTADPTARPYFLLREKDQAPVRVAERVLPLQQGSNFRDVGGYPAAGGKHVKWGLIYRSGGQPMLTEADLAQVGALGLHDLVDLRSNEERVMAPTRINGVRYTAVGYSQAWTQPEKAVVMDMDRIGQFYRAFPTMLAPQLKVLFETLGEGKGPVAFNCSAGQDRTGFATAMILSALGVPRQTILADYHLSTTYRRPQWEMPKLNPASDPDNAALAFFASFQKDPAAAAPKPLIDSHNKALLEYAFAEIDAKWGSVDAYLEKELGVGPLQVAQLRALYLE